MKSRRVTPSAAAGIAHLPIAQDLRCLYRFAPCEQMARVMLPPHAESASSPSGRGSGASVVSQF
jgi:hypothetical protein